MLIASTNFSFAEPTSKNEKEWLPIEMERRIYDYGDVERTHYSPAVEVYFDRSSKEVEFELYNIGLANIYLVDINGNIIDEAIVETDYPTSVYLSSALSKGGFYVVVYSNYIYAEGYVSM